MPGRIDRRTWGRRPCASLELARNCGLNAYWLGISFTWNSLHGSVLPVVLLSLVPEEHRKTYLGLLTCGGLLIAMVVEPVAGALGDRLVSRWDAAGP